LDVLYFVIRALDKNKQLVSATETEGDDSLEVLMEALQLVRIRLFRSARQPKPSMTIT
jgi:hypothetical protein